jgi:hypothetical protein
MTVGWGRMVFLPVNLIKKLPLILRQINESRECYNRAKGETGFDPMQSLIFLQVILHRPCPVLDETTIIMEMKKSNHES